MKRVWTAGLLGLGMLAAARPATRPTTAPTTAPAVTAATPTTVPAAAAAVDVPYKLTVTNHIMVRVKINGHGPYNFIMDTGAPSMIVDEDVAAACGLKATSPGSSARINRLDVEGGGHLDAVRCVVTTPYQLTGMNASGLAGVELHGLMGYSVLSRFKIDIDLARDHMTWTPLAANRLPPPIRRARPRRRGATTGPATAVGSGPATVPTTAEATAATREVADADEEREATLEAVGNSLKFFGPLMKMSMPAPPTPRGWVGIGLARDDADGLRVWDVATDGPAAAAGVVPGDRLLSINGHAVHTIADARRRTAEVDPGKPVKLTVEHRGSQRVDVTVTAGEGL